MVDHYDENVRKGGAIGICNDVGDGGVSVRGDLYKGREVDSKILLT